MFDTTPTDADSFEQHYDDHGNVQRRSVLDPGECRRLDEVPQGRSYHLRVGDLYLTIDSDGVRQTHPNGIPQAEAYGRTTTVDPGEAFAFLHGDYSPDSTHFCLACGVTFDGDADRPCDCPVGVETDSMEFPDIPTRAPRALVDGQLVTRPE